MFSLWVWTLTNTTSKTGSILRNWARSRLTLAASVSPMTLGGMWWVFLACASAEKVYILGRGDKLRRAWNVSLTPSDRENLAKATSAGIKASHLSLGLQ